MNNTTLDRGQSVTDTVADQSLHESRTKIIHEIYKTEVKLAKARASVAGSEMDLKALNGRLKALGK